MAQPDKLRVLYDALNNQYNLGTFDEFKAKMQDENKRRAFYNGVSSAYNLGTFDEFNGKIASSFATAQPATQSQGTVATVDNSVENSQQQQPEEPKWTPTPVQRMGMQMQLDEISRRSKQTMDDFNESMENMRSVQPLTMRSKPRVKFNPTSGKVETTYGALDGRSYSSPELAQQASRKHQAEWVENWENTTEEGRQHRERRIQQQEQDFQDFVNGTSLMFRNDRNNAAEKAWSDAAERTAATNEASANKFYGGDPWLNGGREMHIVNASLYRNETRANYLREHDLDKLFDEAWNNLGEDGQTNAIEDAFLHLKSHYPGADEQQLQQAARELARQQSDRRMYYLAVQKNFPKSNLEYLARKIMQGNTIYQISEGFARSKAGTTGDIAAVQHGEQIFKDNGGFLSSATNVGGTVAGFILDPLTILTAGAGSTAAKGATWLGGKWLAGRGATSLAVEAATRKFSTSIGGRILTGMAAGAGNFGTYEFAKEGVNQWQWGGHINPATGENEGYSFGAMMGAGGHGLMMGAATGWIAPAAAPLSQRLTQATTSTAGKIGVNAGMFGGTVLAEGTIFSIPEWIEGERDAWDVWTDNQAMMLGFKGQHLLKSAFGVLGDMAASRDGRVGFETRLRARLDGHPELRLTEDEQRELDARGYGDLKELVADKELVDEANANRAPSSHTTEIARQGEVKGDRAEWISRLQEMMQDNSISEAARAKMYYLATGRRVPMSTVISGSIEQDGDGYIVNTYGVNGVITSRRHKTKRGAEAEMERVNRQMEFNYVAAGEKYKDWVGTDELTKDAVEAVIREHADELGVYDNAELLRRYKMYRDIEPEERSEAEQRLVDVMDNALNERKDKFGAKAVREDINKKYGVDIDNVLAKEPNRRSKNEQAALEEYVRNLYPDGAFDQQADAAGDGAPDPTQPINPDQAQLTQQPLERTPYERGRDAQPEERRDIVLDMQQRGDEEAQEAYNGMVDRINDDAENEVQRLWGEYDDMRHNDGTMRPATLKLDDKPIYIVDGNVQMMEDGSIVDLEHSDKTVVVFNPETGKREMISPEAILSIDEPMSGEDIEAMIEQHRADFIQKAVDEANGTLALAPGDIVDLQTEDGGLVQGQILANDGQGGCIVALQDGTQMNVEARELQRVADDIALADYRQRKGIVEEAPAAQGVEQPVMEQAAARDYAPDTEIVIRDEDGQEKRGIVQGRVRYDAQTMQFIPDPDGQMIEYYVEGEGMKHDYPDRLDDKVVSYTPVEKPTTEAEPTAQPVVEEQPTEVKAPTGPLTPENATIEGENNAQVAEYEEKRQPDQPEQVAMPMTADEEPDYYAVEPSRAHSYIYNEAGLSRSEANEHVAANYEQAQKDLTKAKAASMPKMGTSIKKFNEAKAQRQQKIDEAQKRVEYWQAVREQQHQIVVAENAEREAREAEMHDAAVAQVLAEREAAKQAETERKAVGNENPMPAITEKWNTATKTDGAADEIVLPNGKRVSGHYVLHESGASSPSHQATAGWKQTDGFPMDVNDNTVNDRDYEHDIEAQRVTEQIAQQYDQRALQTPVVVSKDGVVLSGNGRTMAGELAAKAGTDGAYIDYLKKYAQKYGFTPEQVEAMQHPRVSFVPDEDMPYTADTFSAFNQQEMKSLSKTEQSVKLGKTVSDDTFRKVLGMMNGFDTLGDFYNDANASFNAIALMNNAGVIPQAQMAEMMDGHKLSAVGREMLENMLIGKSFENNPEVVRMLTSVPSMRQSVIFALAEISNNLRLGEEFSLESELADAIKLCYEARTVGKYEHGEQVSGYARQLNLFAFEDEMQTVADINNATILMLADVLNDKRVSQLKKTLVSYNDEAANSASGQLDLFTGDVRKQEEILKDVLTLLNYGTKKDIEATQQAAIERRKAEAQSVQQDGVVEPSNQDGEQPAVEPAQEVQPVVADETPAETEQPTEEASTSELTVQQAVEVAAADVNTTPTPAQIEAGNYKKGHITIGDFDITIENPKGSERKGVDADGKAWSVTMNNTYGYIRGTEGVDGDHIDVFLGENMDEWDGRKVFVVDQTNTDGSFDEHKCMIGFNDEESALSAYLANYSEDWQQTHPNLRITGTNIEDFNKWIQSSHRKTKAFADYASVKPTESTQLVAPRTEGYSMEKRTDTRDGSDIYAVKFEERVSRDEFKGQKEIAKRFGGYWSNFGKKGFLFKSEEAAHDFAETVIGRSVEEVEDEAPITINDVAAVNGGEKPTHVEEVEAKETSWPKEQFEQLKAKHPDALILFHDGEGNYAAYEEDAEKLSSILGMGVAHQNDGSRLAGFPTKALDAYLPRIIRAKQRVAIVDKLDDPTEKKKTPQVVEDIKPGATPAVKKVDVEGLFGALAEDGEAKLSDHAAPVDEPTAEQKKTEEEPKQGKSKFVEDEDAERFEELRKRLHKKLYGQLNSGFDPETFAIGAEMAYLMLKKGARKLHEFAKSMVELMGDGVRPHIKSFYDGARHMMSEDIQREMSSHEEVDAFDALNFDKQGAKDIVATAEHITNERKATEIAAEAKQQIKEKRNEEKRNKERQVAADTEAVVNEAEASASEVESKLETATTEEAANDLGRQVDEQLAKVEEQLAILGYYEAEPIQRDYNEAYGYMRNAERQAHKDIKRLFDRLCEDLGLNLSDFALKDANGKRRKFIHTNIAPAGGDITMRLPLEKGVELYVDFMFEPDGDNLRLTNIMYRPEKNGSDLRANNYFEPNTTYDMWLHGIKAVCKDWLPQEDYVAMAQRIAAEAEQPAKLKKQGKKAAKPAGQIEMTDLFSDFFAEVNQPTETSTPTNNEEVHVQPRSGKAERDGGHEPRQNEPLGKGEQHEVERPDGRGVDRRDAGDIEPNAERSGAVSDEIAEQPVTPAAPKNTRNNHAERGVDYAPKGENARIEANLKAIETMQRLIESGKQATPEDMAVLRKFSGWGGLGAAFKEKVNDPRLRREWQQDNPINKRLRELLTPEQYDAANMSRNSAYYTPAEVIEAMWDVARALGFKGGRVLEGSAGIGNIIGLMPQDMSERSDIHAVEIDDVTGNILSLLYPDAKVDVQGFEKTNVPNGSVDLAITNVPFVTGLHVLDETGDKDLSRKFRDIHDFCIAKNVRKLREGGIGIFITSSGTLDNSQKLRSWLVNEGNVDVVGAFRMHNKTFGGTGATSDIIVVRKRVNGRKSANAIDVSSVGVLRTAEYTDDSGRTAKTRQLALDFNQYFIEHPEFMAGEMRFGFEEGDTFRPTSKALYPSRNGNDQGQMLREWADGLSKMDWEAEKPTTEASATVAYEDLDNASDEPVSEGSMFLNKKGELCIAQRGSAVPLALNANKVKGHTKAECFTAYKGIKDALAEVLEYQTNNDDDAGLQPLIKKLNAAYDAFVNTYGHLNKNTAISFLRNDMDYPSIAALESVSETGDKKGKRIVSYSKTDIFSRRVVEKESEPKPTTVKDGIIASIYLNGRVDVPYIAGQLGISEADVRQQIVESGLGFENPTTTEMEVSYEYLSGNVREKLAQAKVHNEDGRYDANIKALERVVPMDIPAHLIEFTLGTSWLDPKMYEDYVRERTGLEKIHLYNVGGTWIMNEPYYTSTEQNKAMGVRSEKLDRVILGHELIAAALQNRTIQVSKTEKKWDGSTETITDKEATQACANKIDEIRQDFKDWARAKMQEDPELAQKIEQVYNEQFNNYVPKSIPDEFVPEHFGGAARVVNGRPFQLRPHQAKAAIRATTQPLMLAHEVGTGKTYTLITTAMEMRRLGTARKPMIVVQNATVGQFVASAKALYPNAKILTLEDADRNADGRKNFYAKIRYNDWDMIVVPQSVFERIPDSEERQAKFVEDKIEEKMMVLEQMKEASENESRDPNVRQAERELENLQNELNDIRNAQLEKAKDKDEKREAKTRQNAEVQALEMLDRAVDDVANFDDMGIDALLIDEAHEYKHLGFATTMQRGVKGVDPSYSKKSQGVYLKTQAVLENNNGRNVVFATGTPISNTAAEIWTFMRYLMPADRMKEYDIYYFDDFVRNFGNIQNVLEFGASGKYKPVNRFLGYFNLPELVRVWAGVADTVLTREAGGVKEKIPDMEGGQAQDVFLPQTRALRGVMKFVKSMLEEYENMSGKQKKENSHIPLVMYGIAKAAAVDVRLVQDDAPDEPQSKTNETVRQTLRSLKETASYNGTVAIFADNYQNKNTGFNLYEDIRAKLIAAGVPEEQIVVMKSGMTVKKKLEIFDRVNRGEVRVVMGSTFTLGTGVNIQERLHTLIHVDAPNRPMDYTQRNGRILRQGNLHRDWNKPVRVLRFGVEDSLDVTAYQRLKTKGAIADSIMEGKKMVSNAMENRALEEEQDVFGDITAQLSGSQYALLKNQMEKEVKKLQAKRKQWEADQTYIHNQKPRLQGQIRTSEEWKAKNEDALQKLNAAGLGDKLTENGAPVIKIGELEFDGLEAMGEFIKDFNKKQHEIQEQVRSSHSYDEKQTRKLTISVGGIDFVLTSTIGKELKNNQGTFFASATTSMTYSCPELGLVDVPVTGQKIKSALEDIMQNVVTGDDFRDKIERAERMAERYRGELAQIEKREGVPFQFDKELAEAEAKLEEYEALMQKEMEEKEAKYAEVDAEVEAATGVQLSDEEDDAAGSDNNSYRDGDEESNPADNYNERLNLRTKAERFAASYHTPIEIVEDVNTLTAPGNPKKQARMRKAKGWYDTKSGKIVVVMPNNHNVEDVAATMFHEVVAHKGLRELIGEDGYSDFLREVYEHCTEEVRKRIAEKAHKHGWDFEKATDEYLGDLSEKGFEDFDKGEQSLWQKLKAKVLDAINKFLKSLKLPKWVKLGDNELRYMLWRSHKNLQRGKEDVIEQAQDIVKRDELGLGREAFRMGDEPSTFAERQKQAEANKGTVMPGLNDAEVKVVDIPRHSYTGDIKEATRQAAEAAKAKYAPDGKAVTQDYNNHGVSFQYEISGSAIDEALNPKQQNKSSNKGAHLSIIEHLDEIIGESIEAEEHPDYLKDKETGERSVVNPVALMHRFYGAAVIDGQTYRVMTIMREDKRATEANGVHAYEVTKVELLDNEPSSSSDTGTSNVKALVPVSVAKLLQNVEKAYDKGKKLLEESQILDENDGLLFRDPGETGDIWSDASMGFEERMTAAATRLATNHADDKRLKNDAMRAIGGNLANLRRAMSLQRNFDITTVKRVADLARILMDNGFLTGLNQQEVKRLLAAVKNSTGHEDVAASVQKVLDIMVDNQLSHAKETLHQLITIKGSKVDAKGVEVQGQLDPDGARTMQVFKKAHTLPEEDINQRIAEAVNRMSSTDNAVADEAAIEYAGLNLALEYVQNIAASVAEEKELRDDLKQHAEAASARDKATDAYRQYVESMQEAIRKNKTERVEAYYQLVGRMSDALRESLANAADFREAEKQRVREIQHNANSDMEGRPSDEHHKTTWKEKLVNNSFVSFGFAPLATFDQMLRMFGSKSANGEGYLYNRFMRGWVDAREQEIKGVKAKYAILDAKAAEVFGKRGMKWGDLISMERKMQKASVSFWNGGEMQERELSQGNLLYIYMVNKMLDGRIKLRKMGITEEDVENIVDVLDPRFVQLADWLQDEFLVDTRNEYNETHKRMFGASMAAIENYFPLKILANARADKPEDLDNPHEGEGISTTTGSIIKRRRNALALDITGADAFSVILDHVAQMEHWNAYAEWNRDLNTLRTYRRFRNQVQNMTSVYGGGKELWKKFNDVCQMAAGTYRPPRAKLDEAAVNFAKGVTAAKVSFRIFTALKQLLSMPAYLPEARPDHMLTDLVNPIGAWRWSMENLPIFKERWASRMSGDPRLLKSDMDWKLWRSRIMEISSRLGMSPNAFVDALTVSIGAHSMYKTRKGQYISDGYSDEDADRMAKQDATILFNQTQQSSEGPFTSTMQVDRSWLSVLFTVFRNASMSYTRQLYDAVRNMKRNLTPGQRAESIAFMAKQMERDGIDADKARKSAGKKFNRQLLRDALRIGVFGYVMQLAWNLGAYLPYILFGDDEDEKQKMWDDVWAHSMFGSIEGLTGGDLMSQAGAMAVTGEGNPAYLSKDMPLTGDIMTALQKIGKGQTEEALSDMINLVVQSGIGINPQSITDGVLAIMDACGDDPELAHEATICVMRILQVPQSQIDKIYFDEIGLSGDEVSNYTPAQLAERYAHYKVKRGRLYAPWSWNDAEATAKQTKKADTAIKERLDRLGDADANTAYHELEADYKEMSQLFTAFNKAKKAGNAEEATRIGTELQSDPARYQSFVMFKKLDGKLDDLVDFYLKSESAEEANLCKQTIIDFKAGMVRAIQAPDEVSRATAISGLSDMMSDFATKFKGFRGAANQ